MVHVWSTAVKQRKVEEECIKILLAIRRSRSAELICPKRSITNSVSLGGDKALVSASDDEFVFSRSGTLFQFPLIVLTSLRMLQLRRRHTPLHPPPHTHLETMAVITIKLVHFPLENRKGKRQEKEWYAVAAHAYMCLYALLAALRGMLFLLSRTRLECSSWVHPGDAC